MAITAATTVGSNFSGFLTPEQAQPIFDKAAISVATPARRWNNVCRTVQPTIPSASMQSRRRSRLPARATSQPSPTRCPRARDRSAARRAAVTLTTVHSAHADTGTGTRKLQPNGTRAIEELFTRSFGV